MGCGEIIKSGWIASLELGSADGNQRSARGEEGDRPCRLRGRRRRRARRTRTPPSTAASPCTPGSSPSLPRRQARRDQIGIGRGRSRAGAGAGTGDPFRFCWSGARLSACRDREFYYDWVWLVITDKEGRWPWGKGLYLYRSQAINLSR